MADISGARRLMRLLDREIGSDKPIFLIAGPCVIESEDLCLEVAEKLAFFADRFKILIIFKASFDKANRSSGQSFRGPGIAEGLEILARVRVRTGLPILTDVHEGWQARQCAEVCDVLQTPAFLARQTDFIQAVAREGRPVNVKKGQWMMPGEMGNVVDKCRDAGNGDILLCERGTHFGHGDLVVDMRGLAQMAAFGPVVFDATHSVQRPAGLGHKSGGDRTMAPLLAKAAVAAGVSGVFIETHPIPDLALSDGPNMIPLDQLYELIEKLIDIDRITKGI